MCVTFLFTLQSLGVTTAYYSSLDNKSGATLVSALTTLTHGKYSGVKYGSGTDDNPSVWYTYGTSDVYPSSSPYAGKIWEIYAGCTNFTWQTNQGSSCSVVCGTKSDGSGCGYNREHALPKSWFGIASSDLTTSYRGPGVDIHHIYPTDVNVNTKRSNNPYGVVGSPTYTSPNGCKLGTCTWPSGYSGTVFEPADEFKGDLARAYLYMVVTWNAYNTSTYSFTQDNQGFGAVTFNDNMTAAGNFGLTSYGLQLLLTWHRNDPVSQKEIDRNNAIEAVQGNRNPFVDYPCLVEYIWGTKAGETFLRSNAMGSFESAFVPGVTDGCTCSTDPAIVTPSGIVDCGLASPGNSVTKTVTVRGVYLNSGNLTLSLSGTNASFFSLSTSTISKANAEAGQALTITYAPTAAGNHTATLIISGCGVSSYTVTLSGTCATYYTATWMADGTAYHSNTAVTGTSPEVPEDPDDCSSSRVFIGWTTQGGYTNATTAPADLFTTIAPTITANTTFYAVYADETGAGTSTATFSASDISATPLTGTLEWTHETSGIVLKLSAGQRYTSNTPYTFRVSSGSDNYAQLISPYKMTKVVATVTGNNYAISSVSDGWTKSGTTTQTITSSGLKTLAMYASNSYQIRITQLVVTYALTNRSNYSVSCGEVVPVNVTATFINNGATYATRNGLSGNTITINNPTPCDGYTFVGWSTQQYAANNTTAPVIDYTGTFPYSDVTYYAVYSQATGTTPTLTNDYAKITTTDDLTNGNYLIVAYNGSTNYALKDAVKSSYYVDISEVSISDNTISAPDASIIWQVSVSGSTVTFYNADGSEYIYSYTSGTHVNLGFTSNNSGNSFTATVSGGAWTFQSTSTNYYIIYNNSYKEFTVGNSASSYPISLYKQQQTPNTYYTTITSCQCTVNVESEDTNKGTVNVVAL